MYTFSKGWSVRVYICVYFRHYPPPIFCLQGLCRGNQHLAFACLCDHVPTLNVDDSDIGLSVRPIFAEARLEYLCLRSPIIICYPFRLSFPNLLNDGTFTEVRLLGGHSL